jgi:hypothetical protein
LGWFIRLARNKPDQTVVRSPPKPSRSPWLSAAERSELGSIFKEKWSFLEDYRKRWTALIAEQQHRQFGTFIRDIKREYEKLNAISNSVHAKLGKRKYWIERVCAEDGYKPKAKKNESESFLLSAHFFKKDLTKLDMRIKKVFSPVTFMDEDTFMSDTIWSQLFSEEESYLVTAGSFTEKDDGPAYRLWQIWADVYQPRFVAKVTKIDDPVLSKDFNIFSQLGETSA